MRFEFPRPLKGWRVFAGEVGTILLGVLLALGAQELMQSLHWQREVRETRKALDAELARDMAVFQYRMKQIPCVNQRAAEIEKWAGSFRSGKPLVLKHDITPTPGFAVRTEVWDVIDGGIVSRIPLAARLNYSGLYSGMRSFDGLQTQDGEAWDLITEYHGSRTLDEGEIRKVILAANGLRSSNTVLPAFATTMNRQARELGVKPDPTLLKTANPLVAQLQKEACRPYL